jgi:ABC-2 type transport system permease protein
MSGESVLRPPRTAFAKLLVAEAKLAWRTPVSLILGFALPVLLLIIFGSIPAFSRPVAQADGMSMISLYGPILSAFAIAMMALVGLSVPLATYREQGVLRRMSTTPAPPSWVLGAELVVNLAVLLATLIVVNVGAKAFDVPAPGNLGGFVLSVVLMTAALFAIGLWVAAVARTGQGANAIGQLGVQPLLVMVGHAAVFGFFAVKQFKWE